MGLSKVDADESNVFVKPLQEAFEERGDALMSNVAFGAAVYIDPRFHHTSSSSKLFGNFVGDVEVKFILCEIKVL